MTLSIWPSGSGLPGRVQRDGTRVGGISALGRIRFGRCLSKIWADSPWAAPRVHSCATRFCTLGISGARFGVMRILVDKEYRKRVVDKVTDPVVKSFWVDEYTKWNDRVLQEVIAPIQNKGWTVSRARSSAILSGKPCKSFDVRDIMDNRKILIMNPSKGRIGKTIARLSAQ